jgi:uncharacterized cupin superfamily protein
VSRQSYLDDEPWDQLDEGRGIRTRVFDRLRGAMIGASLHELLPGSEGFGLHAHYGCEEIFFVVTGTPTLRSGRAEEQLAPGDVVYCPEGMAGLHDFTNPTAEPARILAISAGRYPDVVVHPERGHAWVATRDPDHEQEGADKGIIARFDWPPKA